MQKISTRLALLSATLLFTQAAILPGVAADQSSSDWMISALQECNRSGQKALERCQYVFNKDREFQRAYAQGDKQKSLELAEEVANDSELEADCLNVINLLGQVQADPNPPPQVQMVSSNWSLELKKIREMKAMSLASLTVTALLFEEPAKALLAGKQAADLEPDNCLPLMYQGLALMQLNRLADAKEQLLKATAKHPSASVFYFLSKCQRASDDFKSSLDSCDVALNMAPEKTVNYCGDKAITYAMMRDLPGMQNAIRRCEEYLQAKGIEPQSDELYRIRVGVALAYGGEASKAVKLLDSVVYNESSDWDEVGHALVARALAYHKLGQQSKALADLSSIRLENDLFLKKEVERASKLIGAAAPKGSSPQAQTSAKWAVLIGISDFKDKSINLKYSAKDSNDLKTFLTTAGGFKSDHVFIFNNEKATKINLIRFLSEELPARVGKNDDLLVYISSHGTPEHRDIAALNYFVTYDTDKFHLYTTAISLRELSQLLSERVKAAHRLLILDTCYSGGFANNAQSLSVDPEKIAAGEGDLVICSSSSNQRSWESKRYQNGVFTGQLIGFLKKKSNVVQSFPELQNAVCSEVETDDRAKQTPVKAGTWETTIFH